MGQQFNEIAEKHKAFIESQPVFFVGTAASDGRVNVSPKGMDCLRVVDQNRVIWLNVTGSGNETATHINHNPRMTLMFNAFAGDPLILRLYGTATCVHQGEAEWDILARQLPAQPGARQIFDLKVDLVQTSCGMAVPYLDYVGERTQLNAWAEKKGQSGIRDYWQKKDQTSIDGKATGILDKSP